jgi:hypothetical protein
MSEFYEGFARAWGMFDFAPHTIGEMVGFFSLMLAPVAVVVTGCVIAVACVRFVRKRFVIRRDRPATRPRGR